MLEKESYPSAREEEEESGGEKFHQENPENLQEKEGEKRGGRRKINIEFIENKSRRHVTFSKRKAGLIKKAYELSTLTGTQVLLLVASETGNVYTFATPKLQPLITKPEGKTLIQACLNPPENDPSPPSPPPRAPSPPPPSRTPSMEHSLHPGVENTMEYRPEKKMRYGTAFSKESTHTTPHNVWPSVHNLQSLKDHHSGQRLTPDLPNHHIGSSYPTFPAPTSSPMYSHPSSYTMPAQSYQNRYYINPSAPLPHSQPHSQSHSQSHSQPHPQPHPHPPSDWPVSFLGN